LVSDIPVSLLMFYWVQALNLIVSCSVATVKYALALSIQEVLKSHPWDSYLAWCFFWFS